MRTPRKLTALILMGVLTASSVAAIPASAKTFNDVPSNHWAYQVIDEISNENIMIGVGNGLFSPESKLTRAEYTAILSNLAPDRSNGSKEVTYTDVPSDAWYADAAEWAVTNGIIEITDGKFKPNDPISRELMADMTYKFVYYNFVSQIINNSSSPGYADQDSISDKYEPSVNILTNNGLLAGRGNNQFVPQGTLTRAEAAAMASRLLEIADKVGERPEEPGTPTDPEEPTDPENPPVDPEEPTDPENPPIEPEDPSEDPNDPANWDLDGAPKWFLVGQPDNITDDQWEQLITYYEGKERPTNANYPASIESLPDNYQNNEELAKKYCGKRMESLYDIMQADLADQAMAADGEADITAEEKKMINLVNEARKDAGESELIVSPALCRAADIRAKEALTCEPHTRPDGTDWGTVLLEQEVGLSYLYYNGYTNAVYLSENQTVRPTSNPFPASDGFTNFMNSELHKENLLTDTHKYIGIGYYNNGQQSAWIQLFGRPQ